MHRRLERPAVGALQLSTFLEGLKSQGMYKFGEPHMVVTALGAHVATEAGPDRIILRYIAVLSQPSLCNETGIKIRVVLGNRTYHGALATVKAKVYPGIAYLSFNIEQPVAISSLNKSSLYIIYGWLGLASSCYAPPETAGFMCSISVTKLVTRPTKSEPSPRGT